MDQTEINMSLDDIIKKKKAEQKQGKLNGTYVQQQQRRPKSQQWRLGRNGPRQVKRLERIGQLRPWYTNEAWKRRTDGLPPSVLEDIANGTLPRSSVFNRVGWNPLYTIARNRVRMAIDFIQRKLPNYQRPRFQPISLPMSNTRRYHNRAQPVYDKVKFQQWVKAQQLFRARERLYKQMLGNARQQRPAYRRNFYQRPLQRRFERRNIPPLMSTVIAPPARAPVMQPPARAPVMQPLARAPVMPPKNDFIHLQPELDEADERAMSHYSAEQDMEDEDPMRSVSPVGSIIVETSSNVSRNPFSNPSFNPFSSRSSAKGAGLPNQFPSRQYEPAQSNNWSQTSGFNRPLFNSVSQSGTDNLYNRTQTSSVPQCGTDLYSRTQTSSVPQCGTDLYSRTQTSSVPQCGTDLYSRTQTSSGPQSGTDLYSRTQTNSFPHCSTGYNTISRSQYSGQQYPYTSGMYRGSASTPLTTGGSRGLYGTNMG